MGNDVLAAQAWRVQLPEPASPDAASRIRVQEEYLGREIVPWLVNTQPVWLAGLHSYHIMRYLDPTHLQNIGGIALVFRFLADPPLLASAQPQIDSTFQAHKARGVVHDFAIDPPSPWAASVPLAYGGPPVADPWARFLASSTALALNLLGTPRYDFQARALMTQNWVHCFGLVTRGVG
jgi:hypothetical protein